MSSAVAVHSDECATHVTQYEYQRHGRYLLDFRAGFMGYIMRRLPFLLVGVLTSIVLSPSAFSTNLAEVYQSAVENDPVLGAAKEDYAARKEIVPQTRAALLPNVNVIGTLSNNRIDFPGADIVDTNPTSPTFGQHLHVDGDTYKQNSWQAQLVQPILDFPAYFNYRGAQARSKEAGYDYTAAEEALIFRVVQAYLNVLRSQDLVDSTSAEEAAVKRQQEQVQQRFDVGLVAITDVLDATAAYDNAVVQRIVAEGAQGIFFETLFTLTGITYDQIDRISAKLPIVNPVPIDEEVWVTAALANNPVVLASRQEQIAAQRDLRARQAGHLPTLDALASYNHLDSDTPTLLFGEQNTRTYALQMQLPIYQGGFTNSRVREARYRLLETGEQVRNREWTVSRDIRNLMREVAIDVSRVEARLKSIKSGESALEATQTGYEVGTRNIVDVLQAQQRLYLSQFELADARYQYMLDLMQLKQTAGVIVEADLMDLNSFADSTHPVRKIRSVTSAGAAKVAR
jgi:outer membrane protein